MASLRTFMKKQIGQIISICPEKKDFPVREDVMFDYYAATNYGITELVYGSVPESGDRNENIEYPDYEADAKLMATRKNMTLVFLWNRYLKKCAEEGKWFYQYRQYCEFYNKWYEENYETSHFDAVIAQKMEVDFAGQTFDMTDPITGEIQPIVVFVAILLYFQYIYAEGIEVKITRIITVIRRIKILRQIVRH